MLLRTFGLLLVTMVCAAAETPLSVQILSKPGGKLVEGLTAADLTASQGDLALKITQVKLEERPLDLVIVVDTRRWDPLDVVVQDSLGALASRLRGEDRAGLLVAGGGVKTVVLPGSPPGHFAAELSRSRVNPGLRLPNPVPNERGPVVYDAILAAVERVPPGDSRQRVVLVVGSGYDNSSQASLEMVTEAALREQVIVALLELPEETFQTQGGVLGQPTPMGGPKVPGGDTTIRPQSRYPQPFPTPRPLPKRTERTLEKIVERTGGESSDDWRGGHGLSALADRMRTRYEVELASFDARLGDAEPRLQGAAAKKYKKAAVMVLQPR